MAKCQAFKVLTNKFIYLGIVEQQFGLLCSTNWGGEAD
jgi:hypothetical protein